MDLKAFGLSAGVSLLFVTANVLTKKSLDAGYEWLTILVSLIAIAAFAAFRGLCKSHGLAVASGIVDALLTISTIAIAIVFFRETLNLKQYIGLAFLIVGLQLVR